MSRIITFPFGQIYDFAQNVFENGQSIRITVVGDSMYPFLRSGIDSVELIKADFCDIELNDIVLVERLSGEYVLHRVFKKTQYNFYLQGDAQTYIEGPLNPEQLKARVKTIWRGDRVVPCSNYIWQLTGKIWRQYLYIKGSVGRFWRLLSCL